MTEILIFKTDVHTTERVQRVATALGTVDSIKQWTVDLEDCDRVLRIVALNLHPRRVEQLLAREGITCEPMEYQL
ncbi:hypothetical protein [Parapedobacter sp. DT-150]|uniref:hypothetical protein n=1 Tax=Parapedobacter sp. DT-150 TaxID=3396162 RepID=UPI003F1ADFF3